MIHVSSPYMRRHHTRLVIFYHLYPYAYGLGGWIHVTSVVSRFLWELAYMSRV